MTIIRQTRTIMILWHLFLGIQNSNLLQLSNQLHLLLLPIQSGSQKGDNDNHGLIISDKKEGWHLMQSTRIWTWIEKSLMSQSIWIWTWMQKVLMSQCKNPTTMSHTLFPFLMVGLSSQACQGQWASSVGTVNVWAT